MAYNNMIRADAPNALDMLKENLSIVEDRINYMQSVNDYYKANGTTQGCPNVEPDAAEELDSRIEKYSQDTPYPGRYFSDNFKLKNQIKSNIERLTNERDTVFKGWTFAGGEAVINLSNNRLQLMFSEKPSEQQRNVLKQNGFKWASKQGAWQRPLDFKTMAAANKIDFIKPIGNKRVSDLQPKPKNRNAPEK